MTNMQPYTVKVQLAIPAKDFTEVQGKYPDAELIRTIKE